MASARVARSTPTATPGSSSTRTRRAVNRSAEDELVKKMNKVLKVADPLPQVGPSRRPGAAASTITKATKSNDNPASKRTASSSISAGTSTTKAAPASTATSARTRVDSTSTARKTVATPSMTRKVTTTRSVPATSSTARIVPSKTASASTSNPAVPAPSIDIDKLRSTLPWAQADCALPDQARGAMSCINSTIKNLGQAVTAGYKHSDATLVKSADGTDISSEKVDEWMTTCEIAVDVLRGVNVKKALGSKALEVEKAAVSVSLKAVALGMYRRALEQLAKGRSSILDKYDHVPLMGAVENPAATSTPGPSRAGSRTPAPTGVSTTNPLIDTEWAGLLSAPISTKPSAFEEPLRTVLFQALICAWISLSALRGNTLDHAAIFPNPVSQPSQLHPLLLSLQIPQSAATYPLQLLYRQFSSVSIRERSQWLHTRSLSFCVLAATLSVDPPSKTTPQQSWEHSLKAFSGFVVSSKSDTDLLRRASQCLGDLVDWAETVIAKRGQSREVWMEGKSWQALMDFWIALSRRLSDSQTIDRALSLMVQTSSILPRTPPRRNLPPLRDEGASPPSTLSSKGKERQTRNGGVAEVLRICGDLAKTNIVLDKYLESPDDLSSAAAESGLKIIDLEELSDAIMGIKEDEDVPAILGKVHRAVGRIRKGCLKILDGKDEPFPSTTLMTAAQHWLGCSIDLTEDLLRSPHDLTSVGTDFVGGAIDSLMTLARMPDASAQSSLTQLDRSRKLCILARTCCSDDDRAEWMRCLAASAHNAATKHFRLNKFSDVLGLAGISAEIAKECLALISSEARATAKWKTFDDFMFRRYDLLAAARYKLGDRVGTLDAYFTGYTAMSEGHLQALQSDLKTLQSLRAWEKLPEMKVMLQRCAHTIIFDHTGATGRSRTLVAKLANLPVDVRGAIFEELVDDMLETSYRSEIAVIAIAFCDAALEAYTVETMPIRRSRVLVRMISIISQSGQQINRVPDLVRQMEEAIAMFTKDPCLDSGLERCRSELTALCLLQQALFAYHDPGSANQVLSLGREAMGQLRQILIPPTISMDPGPSTPPRRTVGASTRSSKKPSVRPIARTTKTPVRSAARAVSDSRAIKGSPRVSSEKNIEPEPSSAPSFDDLNKVCALLGTLTSLFGMLGHVLAKVEALKLLRAIIRREESYLDEYILRSSQLATEYLKLGKMTRAKTVFTQMLKAISDSKQPVSLHPQVEFHLRYTVFLAVTGHIDAAEAEYERAAKIAQEVFASKASSAWGKNVERIELWSRAALAHSAKAAINQAKGDRAGMSLSLGVAFRLRSRIADAACRMAAEGSPDAADAKVKDDDPFVVKAGAEELSKDAVQQQGTTQATLFKKHLYGLQWTAAESLLDAMLHYTAELLHRGSVKDGEYVLKVAADLSTIVKAPVMASRIQARMAEIKCRMKQYETSLQTINEAESGLVDMADDQALGPSGVELVRIKGDVYAKQDMTAEAGEMFEQAMSSVQGLEAVFNTNEALMPSPKKLRASVNSVLSTMANSRSTPSRKKALTTVAAHVQSNEVVLPDAVKHVLRQQAWLLREAGFPEDSEEVLAQIKAFYPGEQSEAEDLFLDGRVGLHTAFSHFKTDLEMSSLTDSTLAIPMGKPQQRTRNRQSTRQSIQAVLYGAERAFIDALSSAPGIVKVEDVRQACLSIALSRAFQTSLGEDAGESTASAADILAAATAITLPREMTEVIDLKFPRDDNDDAKWPIINPSNTDSRPSGSKSKRQAPCSPTPASAQASSDLTTSVSNGDDQKLRDYWQSVRSKYGSDMLLSNQDVSALPPNWIVVSINVTEDQTTMFISRHQANHEPLVFTLPLDRQGKREGEAESDLFTYDAAIKMLRDIIDESNEGARTAKDVVDREGRIAWWDKRFELDRRLEKLCQTMEFCWLGAFKTILSPETGLKPAHLDVFRNKIELVFNRAIFGEKPSPQDSKRSGRVHLDDSLLERFIELSSKCRDEEAEDLVYFILDIYQFCGVQVALAELDIDQLAVDIKTVLADMEVLRGEVKAAPDEHLFLALDKNVSGFPWESIPILRGRAVSRVPSLPLFLDQVRLSAILSTGNVSPDGHDDGKRTLDTKRVFYILNPSGDLGRTQTYFEPWLKEMVETCGWKGIIGRSPTELEMINALTNFDLVLYFGHGGAEQYIRSSKIRQLPKCATTMLWGCSSGALKDQGDFDRTGTAYSYLIGGCPSLVANLWDVTDKDIDRLSEDVLKRLHLDTSHVPHTETSRSSSRGDATGTKGGMTGLTVKMGQINLIEGISSVKAVALAREECKLKYLTGAAPVVYGLPMYLH